MKFQQTLIEGRLIKRYKRFLADVELTSGELVTAHCANPGAMEGLNMPGLKVWLSKSDNPKRKLAYSWELAQLESTDGQQTVLVGINTSRPNALAYEAIEAGLISQLTGYCDIRTEVKYGQNSRIDLLLSNGDADLCYVEVKNAHLLRQPGLAEFPDSRTQRGTKHLRELSQMVAKGHRAVMLYVVQRNDASRFTIAADKDPDYANAFLQALHAGVETIAYRCSLSLSEIAILSSIELVSVPPK